jgi:hypothetical protein
MRRVAVSLIPLLLAAPLPAQKKSTTKPKPPATVKPAPLIPLTQRERAQQLLNRFTFGPRPGDLEQVLAITPEKWFEQQLNPDSIPDPILDKRLTEYTTLNLPPEQALQLFPDRFTISQVADGHRPYPNDPLLAAMYEVQIYKLNRDTDAHKLGPDGQPILPHPPKPKPPHKRKPIRRLPLASLENSSPCLRTSAWPHSSSFPYQTASPSPPTSPLAAHSKPR